MNKAKMVATGFKFLMGFSAGYFVYKLTEDKASELVQEGGVTNAFLIGAGQSMVAGVAYKLATILA